ncbi:EXOSC3 [Cordylochernes scorpioides]|uniref:Ribosomal RNA-processing protein 40 n=1 Tax=Cordylochernes scorpioides TaxID=51811 RepID=A0ABY6KMV8_9ARAC|nr:EXOSC3 [Cordylochernes scorpioides]
MDEMKATYNCARNSRWPMYMPRLEEYVIGTVVKKLYDIVKVDIGAPEPASLSLLNFEGATKRNLPNIQVGDLVYGRVIHASPLTEPEISCVDNLGKKAGMGQLTCDGLVFSITPEAVRMLLAPNSSLLADLGKKVAMETVIGLNGRMWVRAKSPTITLYIYQTILSVI